MKSTTHSAELPLTTLSRILTTIATVRDRTTLLKTIIAELQPLFGFQDVGLFIVNEEEDYHIDLTVDMPQISPSAAAFAMYEAARGKHAHQGSVVAWTMAQVEAAGEPQLLDFVELKKQFPDYPQWIEIPESYRDCLATTLKVQGKMIGMFCINAQEKNKFAEVDRMLFQLIADQLAVVLSNLLVNEQLLAEKQFKETLLGISEAVASIQDRKQLLKTIYQRIAPIFPYDACGLFILTEDKQYHYELIDAEVMDYEPSQVAIEQQFGAHHRYPHPDSPVEDMMQRGPFIVRLEEYMHHSQGPIMYAMGIRQIIAGPLTYGGETIGMLCFNSKQEDFYTEEHLPLFKAISKQLSVATANVLANEAVLVEKAKVERLHFVSEVMTGIQHRGQLQVAFDRIRRVFPFDNAGLFVLEETGQQHYELLDSETLHDDPVQQRLEQQFGKHACYPHVGSPIEAMMQANKVALYDMAALLNHFPDYPQSAAVRQAGLQQVVAAPLRQGGQVIGLLNFNSKQADRFSEADTAFVQAVAEQMSTVVSNILTNEREQEQRWFKEALLDITSAVAKIADRDQLVQVIQEELHNTFTFEDIGLFVFTQDRQALEDLTVKHPQISPSKLNAALHENPENNQPIPFNEESGMVDTINRLQEEGGVTIFNMQNFAQKFPAYQQSSTLKAFGYQDSLTALLTTGGQTLGFFCLNSLHRNFAKKQFPLFQAISDQLAVAINNVLTNEHLIKEKQFKETLLSISEAVASIQNRSQLLKVIFEKVQPVLPFDAPGLFITDGGQHYELLDQEVTKDSHNEHVWQTVGVGPFTNQGTIIQHTIDTQKSHIVPITQDMHPHGPAMLASGLKQEIYGPLKSGGQIIGMFCLNSRQKDQYQETDLPLFQAIADQLATAVSNVLANERLVAEKQFKETLLSISEAVASVQGKKELFKVIISKLKPLFSFDSVGLFVVNQKEDYHVDWAADMPDIDESKGNQVFFEQNIVGKLPHNNSSVAWAMQQCVAQNGPVLQSFAQVPTHFSDHHALATIIETGHREWLFTNLMVQGEVIGMFCINFFEKGSIRQTQFPLFQAIADQLAVAVANILSNEQLLEEKKKTEDLLTVTEAIANINSGPELIRVIFDKLQRVFPFDEAGLFHLDFERQRERDLIVDYGYDTTVSSAQLKEQGLSGWLPLQKVTLYFVNQGPSFMSTEELFATFDHPHFNEHTKSFGFKQVIASPLKKGDETMGLLYFWSKTDHFFNESLPLFKSISDQLSVALSNILANEDIRRREQENALQVAVVNALNSGSSWEEKLLGVARHLQAYVPFDLMTVALSEERPDRLGYAVERIGHEEYRLLSAEAFLRLTQLSVLRYQELRSQHTYSDIFVANGDDFVECCQQDPIKRAVAQAFSMQANLTVPLPLSRRGHFQLAFYCKRAAGYQPAHQQLMRKIVPSLTLALEKLVAYDEIRELNARLSQEKTYLEEEIKTHYNFGQIVGESPALQAVFTQIGQVAATDSTVLLLGETGTGKELVARALHEGSPRQRHSLIKINCAALPPQLIESELFGHERGAFTGAVQRRIGKFELADSSTIFLDEIGELPMELQSKLLRVLQEKEFERLGSNQVRRVDARVVAATNRDLEEEVREGRFRQDLYYRLNVFPIHLPPLRERGDDIPLLATFFVQKYVTKFKKRLPPLTDAQLRELTRYSWPGNVRELEHLIERAVIQANRQIGILNIPISLPSSNALATFLAEGTSPKAFVPQPWKDTEVEILINTLRYCGGKVRGEGGAAQLLGLHPNTLESRMKKLDIRRQHVIDQGKG